MARVVNDQHHRKELVAGGLSDFLHSSKLKQNKHRPVILHCFFPGYRAASEHLGNHATDFFEVSSIIFL